MVSFLRSGPDSVLRFAGFGQRGKWHVTSLLGNGTIETPLSSIAPRLHMQS
jgi:hypothetical protein